MPIDLLCTQCHAKLRLPDEAAGSQGKCPHCEAVFDIDNAPAIPQPIETAGQGSRAFGEPDGSDGPASNPYFKPLTDANPYAAPQGTTRPPEVPSGPLELGRVDPAMSLRLSWDLFRGNLPVLLTTHITFLVISLVIWSLTQASVTNASSPFVVFVVQIVGTGIQWYLTIGTILVTLGVARGQEVHYDEMFAGGKWFLKFGLGQILMSLPVYFAIASGVLPLLLVAAYLYLRFWPAMYFIIDRDMEVMDAFRAANEFTNGNKMPCLMLSFLSFGVTMIGFLALCVGVVAALPVVNLMWTLAYMMMTRQPIQRPPA